jgi:hypothetical protein
MELLKILAICGSVALATLFFRLTAKKDNWGYFSAYTGSVILFDLSFFL